MFLEGVSLFLTVCLSKIPIQVSFENGVYKKVELKNEKISLYDKEAKNICFVSMRGLRKCIWVGYKDSFFYYDIHNLKESKEEQTKNIKNIKKIKCANKIKILDNGRGIVYGVIDGKVVDINASLKRFFIFYTRGLSHQIRIKKERNATNIGKYFKVN